MKIKLRKRKIMTVMVFTLMFTTVMMGCTNMETTEYKNFAKSFYKNYFEVVEKINLKNTMEAYKVLKEKKNCEKVKEIKRLLDDIKVSVPESKREKYEYLYSWYEGLVMLQKYSEKDWRELTVDQRCDIFDEISLIESRKNDWNDKDSNIVWD